MDAACIIRCLEAGECPWCSAGPFRVPISHISRAHGIDRFEIRDMIGVPIVRKFTDPDYSEQRSETTKRMLEQGILTTKHANPGTPHRRTKALIQSNRRKAEHSIALAGGSKAFARRGREKALENRAAERHANPHVCSQCGDEFQPIRKGMNTRTTCSEECRRAQMRMTLSRVNHKPRTCLQCGAAFYDKPGHTRKTCSAACAKERQRQAAVEREARKRAAA